MIERTFCFLPGISYTKERKLWVSGIRTWNDFLRTDAIPGMSDRMRKKYLVRLMEAKHHLLADNEEYFYRALAPKDMWRLYDRYRDEIVYLDIERNSQAGDITIVGLSDGYDFKLMMSGLNLEKDILFSVLDRCKLIVAFNGLSHDIPYLEKYFGCKIKKPHIDVRHLCSRLGLTGSLKEIESLLGIERDPRLNVIGNQNVIGLWKCFKATGERRFLDLLALYNEEDVVNLKRILEYCIKQLAHLTCLHEGRATP